MLGQSGARERRMFRSDRGYRKHHTRGHVRYGPHQWGAAARSPHRGRGLLHRLDGVARPKVAGLEQLPLRDLARGEGRGQYDRFTRQELPPLREPRAPRRRG